MPPYECQQHQHLLRRVAEKDTVHYGNLILERTTRTAESIWKARTWYVATLLGKGARFFGEGGGVDSTLLSRRKTDH